jgi:hypothetical protein
MWLLKQTAVFALAFASLVSVAQAAPIQLQCGASVKSIVRTNIDVFNTTSEIPVNITGAAATFDVPAGNKQCVRVRFSATASCPNACFLRAILDNTSELNPAWSANPLRFSLDGVNAGTAHSLEWVALVGPGSHSVQIKMQTGNTCCTASIGPWTTSVDILE